MLIRSRRLLAFSVVAAVPLAGCSLIGSKSRPDPEAENVRCDLEYAPAAEGEEASLDLIFRAWSAPWNEEAFYMSLPDVLLHSAFAPGRHLRADMLVEGATCTQRPWGEGFRLPRGSSDKVLRCKRDGLDRVLFGVETKWGTCRQEIATGDGTPQRLGVESQSTSAPPDAVVFATAPGPLPDEPSLEDDGAETPGWGRRWQRLYEENDRRLEAGDWAGAEREARRLLRGALDHPGRGAFLGVGWASYQRAVALAGLHRLADARRFAEAARAFFPQVVFRDVQSYGEPGARVAAWIRAAAAYWNPDSPVPLPCSETSHAAGFVPTVRVGGEPPLYPNGPREQGSFGVALVSFVVDERGVPRAPGIDTWQLYFSRTAYLWATLEAVREWRFEPARSDGEPVSCRYTVAASFNRSGP